MALDPLPCFRCFIMEDMKARACHPEDCKDLTNYLLFEHTDDLLFEQPKEQIEKLCCPSCGSATFVKHGITLLHGKATQRYRCKTCHREFHPNRGFTLRKRHSNQVIQYAQSLGSETDPAYSTRDIAKMVKQKYGLKVSHTTILAWLRQEDLTETTVQNEAA